MKTNPTPLACRVVRTWTAFRSGGGPHGFAARHVATCAGCQGYFAATDQLTAALRRDAVAARQPAPAGSEEQILRAIARSRPQTARKRPFGPMVLALACAAALVTIAVLPQWRSTAPAAPHVAPPPIARQDVALTPVPTTAPLRAMLNALPTLQASVTTVLEKEPLQQEVTSVYADAQSAVRFLAMNFLPGESPTALNGRTPSAGG